MYEDGIDVVYEVRLPGRLSNKWSQHHKVTLPGWCAGDAQMALALYLFGHRDYAEDVRVTDWQPHDEDEDEPEGTIVGLPPMPDPARQPGETEHEAFHRRSLLPQPSVLCVACFDVRPRARWTGVARP